MAHYADDFRSGKRDRTAWRAHKDRVFAAAGRVGVGIDELGASVGGDVVTVEFTQSYRSERHRDRGRKTLRLTPVGDSHRIVAEDWQPR